MNQRRYGFPRFEAWKPLRLTFSLLLALLAAISISAQEPQVCTSHDRLQELLATDESFRDRYRQSQKEINDFLELQETEGPSGLHAQRPVIPVVVHVLHNDGAENISDQQIQSQIDILNEVFRRANADLVNVPGPFQPLIGNAGIEFALARRDPNCNTTNGITRTRSMNSVFYFQGDTAMSSVLGGQDPWPTDRYLNVWVVPRILYTPMNAFDITGYAAFPGTAPDEDGIVIRHDAVGDMGTATPPTEAGRVLAHEIGHYLDVFHIWGDDQSGPDVCAGSDRVDDTPNQAVANDGCADFPSVTCDNGPDGDMFVNFMDYSDDDCTHMFTAGQVDRMLAALYTQRSGLLGSDALIPPSASWAGDLFSADTPADVGDEPNPFQGSMHRSEDIWIRRQADGFGNQEHQNPIHGQQNYVYVRVRNRSCDDAEEATLRLYWAKASAGLGWPAPWDGSVGTPARMGAAIGSQPTGIVPARGTTVLEFPWTPPDPADYTSFGADKAHFCLLSRVLTEGSAPFGMTFPETSNLVDNVRNNNNIAWKNVSIATQEPAGDLWTAQVMVANHTDQPMPACLAIPAPDPDADDPVPLGPATAFDWGRVILDLGPELYSRWVQAGQQGFGYENLGPNRVELFGPNPHLCGLDLAPGEIFPVNLDLAPFGPPAVDVVLPFDLLQYRTASLNDLVGGQRIVLELRSAVSGDPHEPDDLYNPTLVSCNTSISREIWPLHDVDAFFFTTWPGTHVTLDIDAADSGSTLNSTLAWTDVQFIPMDVNDDDPRSNTVDSYLEFPASSSAAAWVAVSASPDLSNFDGVSAQTTGHYTLTITCADPLEPNDVPTEATPLSCSFHDTYQTSLHAGDVDWYRLSGVPGEMVSIDVDAQVDGSALDASLIVFDNDTTTPRATSHEAAGPGESLSLDPALRVAVPADGDLFVAVAPHGDDDLDGSGGTTEGPYTLSVRCYRPLDCASAGSASYQVGPGPDVDYYQITGVPGSVVRFDVDAAEIGSGLDARLGVFGDAFGLLEANDAAPAPLEVLTSDPYLERVLPQSGSLYFAVAADGDYGFNGFVQGLSTGPYNIDVDCTCEEGCEDFSPCTTDSCGINGCVHIPKPDEDGDGICDEFDTCLLDFNPLQNDLDLDGFGDECDNCYHVFNPTQGIVTHPEPVLATPEGFEWTTTLSYVSVAGYFSSSGVIGVLDWFEKRRSVGNSFTDPYADPVAGQGIWYLFKPNCPAGSWQVDFGQQSPRDLLLP